MVTSTKSKKKVFKGTLNSPPPLTNVNISPISPFLHDRVEETNASSPPLAPPLRLTPPVTTPEPPNAASLYKEGWQRRGGKRAPVPCCVCQSVTNKPGCLHRREPHSFPAQLRVNSVRADPADRCTGAGVQMSGGLGGTERSAAGGDAWTLGSGTFRLAASVAFNSRHVKKISPNLKGR